MTLFTVACYIYRKLRKFYQGEESAGRRGVGACLRQRQTRDKQSEVWSVLRTDFPLSCCGGDKALRMSRVLTADFDALGGLHFLVVSQRAFVFTLRLPADGSQGVGVGILHQDFLALVEREGERG